MYKEIHPYKYDAYGHAHAMKRGEKRPMSEFFTETSPVLLRLDTIRYIKEETIPDGSVRLIRLCVSDDRHEDLTVKPEEAEEIKMLLLKNNLPDETAQELHALTAAVRDLWTLLKARMH